MHQSTYVIAHHMYSFWYVFQGASRRGSGKKYLPPLLGRKKRFTLPNRPENTSLKHSEKRSTPKSLEKHIKPPPSVIPFGIKNKPYLKQNEPYINMWTLNNKCELQ